MGREREREREREGGREREIGGREKLKYKTHADSVATWVHSREPWGQGTFNSFQFKPENHIFINLVHCVWSSTMTCK